MAFEMPRANKPEDVGLSSQRLQRIRDTLQADIDNFLANNRIRHTGHSPAGVSA